MGQLLLTHAGCLPAPTVAAYTYFQALSVTAVGGSGAVSDAALHGRACTS